MSYNLHALRVYTALLLAFLFISSNSAAQSGPTTGQPQSICGESNIQIDNEGSGGRVLEDGRIEAPTTPDKGPLGLDRPGSKEGVSPDGKLTVVVGPVTGSTGGQSSGGGSGGGGATDPTQAHKVTVSTPGPGVPPVIIWLPPVAPGMPATPIPIPASPVTPPTPGPGGGGPGGGGGGAPNSCGPADPCSKPGENCPAPSLGKCVQTTKPTVTTPGTCKCVEPKPERKPGTGVTPKPTAQPEARQPVANIAPLFDTNTARAQLMMSSIVSKGGNTSDTAQYFDRGGDWYWSYEPQPMLINIFPSDPARAMIWYLMNGNVIVWEQLSDQSYRMAQVSSNHGVNTDYIYASNAPGSPIKRIQSGGGIVEYTKLGNTLVMQQFACTLAYQDCKEIPGLEKRITYTPGGNLLSAQGMEAQYVNNPITPGLYNLASTANNRLEQRWYYDSNGRVSSTSIGDSNGNQRFLYNVTWDTNNRVHEIIYPSGYKKVFSYSQSNGHNIVNVTTTDGMTEYTYNSSGFIINIKETPSNPLGSDTSREVGYSYLPQGSGTCHLVNSVTTKLGDTFQQQENFYYDEYDRLIIRENIHPNSNNATVFTRYTYSGFQDGSLPIEIEYPNGNKVSCDYSFKPASDDTARRMVTESLCSTSTKDANGATLVYTSQTKYHLDGKVDYEVAPNGTATKYLYAGEQQRGLLIATIHGQFDGIDAVIPNHNATYARLERDSLTGKITAFVDGAPGNEHRIEFSYNGDMISGVRDTSNGQNTRYYYTWDRQLAASTRAAADHTGSKFKNLDGLATGFDYYSIHVNYDANGRAATVFNDTLREPFRADAPLNAFARVDNRYNPNGTLAQVITPLGATFDYNYNGYGELAQSLHNGVLAAEYFSNGPIASVRMLAKDNGGILSYNTSTTRINRAGSVIEAVEPNGYRSTYSYDSMGNMIQSSTYSGGTLLSRQLNIFDDLNRVIETKVVNPNTLAQTTTQKVVYGVEGINEVYDQFGIAAKYTWDELGRIAVIQQGTVNKYYQYKPNSLLLFREGVESSPGKVYWSEFAHNLDGSVKSLSSLGLAGSGAKPVKLDIGYDTFGNTSYLKGPAGHEVFNAQGPDGFNHYVRMATGIEAIAERRIDRVSQTSSITKYDAAKRASTVVFGIFGIKQFKRPGVPAITYEYDRASNLIKINEVEGQVEIGRDQLGRLERLRFVSSNSSIGSIERWFERDSLGMVEWIKEKEGSVVKSSHYSRDEFYNVSGETLDDPTGVKNLSFSRIDPVTGQYDLTNRIHSYTTNGLTEAFTYSQSNRNLVTKKEYLNPLPGMDSLIMEVQYDGIVPTSIRTAGNRQQDLFHDSYGRIAGELTTVNGVVTEQQQYVYNDLSQIVNNIRSVGSPEGVGRMYSYDPKTGKILGEKTVASMGEFAKKYSQAAARDETIYTYDRLDKDRLSNIRTIGVHPKNISYTYNKATGWPSTVNGTPIVMNSRGEIQSAGGISYGRDAAGRVRSISGLGQQALIDYDVHNKMVRAGAETHVWGNGNVASSAHGGNTTHRAYSGGLSEQIAQYTYNSSGNNTSKLYTSWALVDPANSYDAAGQKIESYAFSPTGQARVYSSQGGGAPQASSAIGRSSEGNLNLVAQGLPNIEYTPTRFYDSNTGLFDSADLLDLSAMLQGTHMRTLYPGQHDRTGLWGWGDVFDCVVAFAEGAVTAAVVTVVAVAVIATLPATAVTTAVVGTIAVVGAAAVAVEGVRIVDKISEEGFTPEVGKEIAYNVGGIVGGLGVMTGPGTGIRAAAEAGGQRFGNAVRKSIDDIDDMISGGGGLVPALAGAESISAAAATKAATSAVTAAQLGPKTGVLIGAGGAAATRLMSQSADDAASGGSNPASSAGASSADDAAKAGCRNCPGERWLDVGTGKHGSQIRTKFEGDGRSVLTLDIDPTVNPGVKPHDIVGDFLDPHLATQVGPESFDVITLNGLRIPKEMAPNGYAQIRDQIIAQANRLLKPGGRLIINDMASNGTTNIGGDLAAQKGFSCDPKYARNSSRGLHPDFEFLEFFETGGAPFPPGMPWRTLIFTKK